MCVPVAIDPTHLLPKKTFSGYLLGFLLFCQLAAEITQRGEDINGTIMVTTQPVSIPIQTPFEFSMGHSDLLAPGLRAFKS